MIELHNISNIYHRVPHHANTVLQDTVVPLLVPLSAPVQQALSLCKVWLTALSVLLDTCVHHQNKELFAVRLEPRHLAKEGNWIVPIALQVSNAQIQSEYYQQDKTVHVVMYLNFHSVNWTLWLVDFGCMPPLKIKCIPTWIQFCCCLHRINTASSVHDFKMAWSSASANINGPDNNAIFQFKTTKRNNSKNCGGVLVVKSSL